MKPAEDVLGYAAAQGLAEGVHKGLSGLAGLKLRAQDLQIDVFHDAAVATLTMVVTIQSGADAITKRERGRTFLGGGMNTAGGT